MKVSLLRTVFGVAFAVLGIFLVGYGTSVSKIGSGSTFYRIWYVAGAFCIALTAIIINGAWLKVPKVLRITAYILIAIGLLMFGIVEAMIIRTFQRGDSEDCEYLIVAGAQIKDDGPSVILRQRLERALEYLNAHPDTICIVTGGQGENESMPEGKLMKEWLVERGIAEERILVKDQSLNTAENMKYSRKLIPDTCTSVGVLTSNFHLFRAGKLAEAAGIPVTVQIGADSNPYYLPHNCLREFFGVVKDAVVGNLRKE